MKFTDTFRAISNWNEVILAHPTNTINTAIYWESEQCPPGSMRIIPIHVSTVWADESDT